MRGWVRDRITERVAEGFRLEMESRVATRLAIRIDRWAVCIDHAVNDGMELEAWGLLRVAEELFVTLEFILFGGPAAGKGSPSDLALRYMEFSHYKRWRIIDSSWKQPEYRRLLKGATPAERWGTLREAYRDYCKADAAHRFTNRNGGHATRWTPYSYPQLVEWTLKALPYYVHPIVPFMIRNDSTRAMQSSWLHADSYAERSFETLKEDGSVWLDELSSGDTMPSQTAALLAYYGWMAVGGLLGIEHEIEAKFAPAAHIAAQEEMAKYMRLAQGESEELQSFPGSSAQPMPDLRG
jgi:hypothetical protein